MRCILLNRENEDDLTLSFEVALFVWQTILLAWRTIANDVPLQCLHLYFHIYVQELIAINCKVEVNKI